MREIETEYRNGKINMADPDELQTLSQTVQTNELPQKKIEQKYTSIF
jgi:hypothetical protein